MYIKIIIIFTLAALLVILGAIFFITNKSKQPEKEEENHSIEGYVEYLKTYFNDMTDTGNSKTRYRNRSEIKQQTELNELRKAIRNCNHGDAFAKNLVKQYIKDWLTNVKCKEPGDLDRLVPFRTPELLSPAIKFEILLYEKIKEYGNNAANVLINELIETAVTDLQTDTYIDVTMLEEYYNLHTPFLSYDDKAEIITELIYRRYKGHGVIDTLRDMEIDGISAGVSGIVEQDFVTATEKRDVWNTEETETLKTQKNYESVWLFLNGNMIHLRCLSFGTEAELERVCKNIYRYNSPGQLSAAKGFIANEMKDGSRVIVVRPPFSEGWAFFIRKFGRKGHRSIEELIKGPGREDLILMIKYMVAGCQVFGITGEQGCGKTTMLKAIIDLIPKEYTLRIQELVFELHLREEYPLRNIVSFRETSDVSGREALDLQKKTDGMVNIIGEVASAPVAGWLVMVSQVASRFTIFTHHAKTTENLILSLRNDLMSSSGFNNEEIAQMQVRQAVRFDVHMVRRPDGTRCIERITEILEEKNDGEERVLIRLTEDGYKVINAISERTQEKMLLSMSHEEKNSFLESQKKWQRGEKLEEKSA